MPDIDLATLLDETRMSIKLGEVSNLSRFCLRNLMPRLGTFSLNAEGDTTSSFPFSTFLTKSSTISSHCHSVKFQPGVTTGGLTIFLESRMAGRHWLTTRRRCGNFSLALHPPRSKNMSSSCRRNRRLKSYVTTHRPDSWRVLSECAIGGGLSNITACYMEWRKTLSS